jgi:hypothetical protein
MVIAYPLKKQYDYTELRYSLRSIEKFITPPYEILIIGERLPDWINNVTWIYLPDIISKKQLTIKYKTFAALQYSKQVLQMNDDVYLLKPYNPVYYYHGDLKTVGEAGAIPLRQELEKMGKDTRNFDGHYAIEYDYRLFPQVFANFKEDVIVKSAYCNYLGIEGEFVPDNKIIGVKKPEDIIKFIANRSSFSSGSHSLASCLPILEELFPSKSKYEV